MTKKIIIFILVIPFLFSCGSGTFENDPQTWNKVFGENIPKDVKVLNSRFWKSAHWSYEFELYIEYNATKEFNSKYLINRFNFNKTKTPMLNLMYEEEKPSWFVPKEFDNYDIFESSLNNMVLFLDKSSRRTFLFALQL